MAVIISGIPGSGKTTLARGLAPALGWPLLAKDTIKEALADAVGGEGGNPPTLTESRALGAQAFTVLWALAAEAGPRVVIEAAWWPEAREHFAGLPGPHVEVRCDCPTEEAGARAEARRGGPDRHRVHHDVRTTGGSGKRPELGIGSVITADTTRPVDVQAVAAQIRRAYLAQWLTLDRAQWLTELPAKRIGAGVLVRDEHSRVLLVEPAYKPRWEIPGGLVEAGESPQAAAAREVREELGADLPVGRLLVADWVPAAVGGAEGIMFVFDGGALASDATFTLPPDELRSARFVAPRDLDGYVRPHFASRLRTALRASAEDRTVCCEAGVEASV